jgi:hypothetical protein
LYSARNPASVGAKEPTKRSIVIEKEMPHPPEKIWRALTEGPLIEEWLMKNDFQPAWAISLISALGPCPIGTA